MTAMLLALVLSDAALNESKATVYRFVVDPKSEDERQTREWKPGIDSWTVEGKDCPVFFQREIEDFGTVQVAPRCQDDDEVRYAL